jgi:hypothetical protein
MRDIIAALLRDKGWTHDDESDPADMHWHHSEDGGARHILVAVSVQMGRDLAAEHPAVGGYYTPVQQVQTSYLATVTT